MWWMSSQTSHKRYICPASSELFRSMAKDLSDFESDWARWKSLSLTDDMNLKANKL